MDKDALYQQLKKEYDRLRWAGLSSDSDFVQLCHEMVECNAERIEKILKFVADNEKTFDILVLCKDEGLPNVSEDSLKQANDFLSIMRKLMCHFCECIDIQSNFLLMEKNALILQNSAEKALVYRHIQVDVVRAFQKLNGIDTYIRKNDSLFSVETLRRECNKQKCEMDEKYGIKKGLFHDARNKVAAHWDDDVDYVKLYYRSKEVSESQMHDMCKDMFTLTQSYSNCLRNALDNYVKGVKELRK